jgi:hypothetical protein
MTKNLKIKKVCFLLNKVHDISRSNIQHFCKRQHYEYLQLLHFIFDSDSIKIYIFSQKLLDFCIRYIRGILYYCILSRKLVR